MTTNQIIAGIANALAGFSCEVNLDPVKQGFKENTFAVNLIATTPVRQMNNKWTADFSFDVIYYTLLKGEAYTIADQLILLLNNITTADGSMKGSKMSYKYLNADSLHFLVTYTVSLYQQVDFDTLMGSNTTTGGLKGE